MIQEVLQRHYCEEKNKPTNKRDQDKQPIVKHILYLDKDNLIDSL